MTWDGLQHGRRIAYSMFLCALLATTVVVASDTRTSAPMASIEPFNEFHFVRLAYTSLNGGFRGGERWLMDYPEAEEHLIEGIGRLSKIDIGPEGVHMRIMDPKLFDYPWVYAVEVGGWLLSDEEAARLRDYLLRGGFLMVDDFHGTYEWEGFVQSMRRVFPDRPIVEIPVTDPIFHLAYDLDNKTQIPGTIAYFNGVTYEKDGYTPHWRGIYDDKGRLMVVIDFNMDLGDAWEHADNPQYPVNYTVQAYKFAINYALYAMTH